MLVSNFLNSKISLLSSKNLGREQLKQVGSYLLTEQSTRKIRQSELGFPGPPGEPLFKQSNPILSFLYVPIGDPVS